MAGIVALGLPGVAWGVGIAHGEWGPTLGASGGEVVLSIGVCVAAGVILGVLWWKNVIRPGSLGSAGKGSKRDVSGLPAVIWLVAACAIYVAPAFGASLAMSLPSSVLEGSGTPRHDGIVAVSGYAAGVAVGALMVYLLIARAPNAGLRFRGKDVLVGAGAFLLAAPVLRAVSIVSTAVYTMVNGAPPDPIAHSVLEQINEHRSDPWIVGVIGAAVLGAPIVEELTYRVMLQSALARVLVSRWLAVLGTSVLFALVHRAGPTPVPWQAIPVIFGLGVAAGVAYERTGRLGVPIVMHVLFNGVNVARLLSGVG